MGAIGNRVRGIGDALGQRLARIGERPRLTVALLLGFVLLASHAMVVLAPSVFEPLQTRDGNDFPL